MADGGEADPPERDVKDFNFRQLRQIRVFPSPPEDLPTDRASLLAVSNKYGYTIVGCPTGIRIFKTAEIEKINHEEEGSMQNVVTRNLGIYMEIKQKIVSVMFSCDELTLAVCSEQNGITLVIFFDVPTLFSQESSRAMFGTVPLSSNSDVRLQTFLWNPGNPGMFAVNLSDGSAAVWELSGNSELTHLGVLPPDSNITSMCWSPKGKQFVVGLKDGGLIQYAPTPAWQVKREISCPEIFTYEPHQVVDLLWISAYLFAAVYILNSNDEDLEPKFVLIAAPKNEATTVTNFYDVYFGMNNELREQCFFLKHITEWNMLVSVSCNAYEVVVIAKTDSEKTSPWEKWNLEETGRAETPLTSNSGETFPMGLAVDFTSSTPVMEGEKKLPPSPILMLLSTDGVLCPFYLVNQTKDTSHNVLKVPEALPPAAQRNRLVLQQSSKPGAAAPNKVRLPPQGTNPASRESPKGTLPLSPKGQQTTAASPFAFPSVGAASQKSGSSLGTPGQTPAPSPFKDQSAVQASRAPVVKPVAEHQTVTTGQLPAQQTLQLQDSLNTAIALLSGQSGSPAVPLAEGRGPPVVPAFPVAAASQKSGSPLVTPGQTPGPSPFKDQSAVQTSRAPVVKPVAEHQAVTTGQLPAQQTVQRQGSLGAAAALLSCLSDVSSPVAGPSTLSWREQPVLTMKSDPVAPEPRAESLDQAIAGLRAAGGNETPSHGLPFTISEGTSGLPKFEKTPESMPPQVHKKSEPTPKQSLRVGQISHSQHIREEIMHFNEELSKMRKNVEKMQATCKFARQDELLEVKKETDELTWFLKSLKETTKEHNNEINEGKEKLLKAFDMVDDASIRQERKSDPRYVHLLKSRNLDPVNANKMKGINDVYLYLEKTLREIHMTLDDEWDKENEKKRILQRPAMDSMYRTLKTHHQVLQDQAAKLDKISEQMKIKRLLSSSWQKSSVSSFSQRNGELSALERSPTQRQEAVVESPSKEPATMSKRRLAQLRDMLQKRQNTPVRRSRIATSVLARASLKPESLDEEEIRPPKEDKVPTAQKPISPTPSVRSNMSREPLCSSTPAMNSNPLSGSSFGEQARQAAPVHPQGPLKAATEQSGAFSTPFSAPTLKAPSPPTTDQASAFSQKGPMESQPLVARASDSETPTVSVTTTGPATNTGFTLSFPTMTAPQTTASVSTLVNAKPAMPADTEVIPPNARPSTAAAMAAINRAAARPPAAAATNLDPSASIEPVTMVVHKPSVETEGTDKNIGENAAKVIADAALKAAQAEAKKSVTRPPQSSTEFTFKSDGTKPGPPVVTVKPASALPRPHEKAAPNVTVKPFSLAPTLGSKPAFGVAPPSSAEGGPEEQIPQPGAGMSELVLSQSSGLFSSIGKPSTPAGFSFAPKAITTTPTASNLSCAPKAITTSTPSSVGFSFASSTATTAPFSSGVSFAPQTTRSTTPLSTGITTTAAAGSSADGLNLAPKTTFTAPSSSGTFSFAEKAPSAAAPPTSDFVFSLEGTAPFSFAPPGAKPAGSAAASDFSFSKGLGVPASSAAVGGDRANTATPSVSAPVDDKGTGAVGKPSTSASRNLFGAPRPQAREGSAQESSVIGLSSDTAKQEEGTDVPASISSLNTRVPFSLGSPDSAQPASTAAAAAVAAASPSSAVSAVNLTNTSSTSKGFFGFSSPSAVPSSTQSTSGLQASISGAAPPTSTALTSSLVSNLPAASPVGTVSPLLALSAPLTTTTSGGLFDGAGGLFGASAPVTAMPAATTTAKSTPSTAGGGLFGNLAQVASAPATATSPGGRLFGNLAPVATASVATTPSTSGLPATASTTTGAGGTLFGSASPLSTAAAATSTTLSDQLFGAASTAPNAGGGLFEPLSSAASTNTDAGLSAATATTPATSGTLFGLTTPSTSLGLFGTTSTAATPGAPAGSIFGTVVNPPSSVLASAAAPASSGSGSFLLGSSSLASPLFDSQVTSSSAATPFGSGATRGFGSTTSSAGTAFSSATVFGAVSSSSASTGLFGTPASTSQPTFVQSAFGQPASTNPSASGLGFGFGGFGLGGQASPNANKNPFGVTQGFSSSAAAADSSLFGGKTNSEVFKPAFGAGSFSGGFGSQASGSFSKSAGSSVASSGFGVPSSQPAGGFGSSSGFSGSPGFGSSASVFGGQAAFGAAPAFGAALTFGGSPQSVLGTSPGRVFGGGGGNAAPVFGQSGESPMFGALASGGSLPTFGNVAGPSQNQQQGFGGNNGSPFGGGFGSPQSGGSFNAWR